MTNYKISIKKSAQKEIKKLPHNIILRVVEKIELLSIEPKPSGYKKLVNSNNYRIRIGDYRVIYQVDEAHKEIEIFRIRHRKDIYN